MLANATRFAARGIPNLSETGEDLLLVVVKGSFELTPSGGVVVAAEPNPVRLVDEPFDSEAVQSSLRYASDASLPKRGLDVVVVGDAVSPEPVAAIDVEVQVGEHPAQLRVHGARYYDIGPVGVAIGGADAFERATLCYEKAYGGSSADNSLVELRNPVGRGVALSERELIGTLAPQLEHPARPHRLARDRHTPWSFGPLPSHWQPRAGFFGTLDEAWRKKRMPLPPTDYDCRFNNVAHSCLQLAKAPAVGAPVAVAGMHAEGVVRFALPSFTLGLTGLYESGRRSQRAVADTLMVEPNERRFELVARAVFPIGRTNLLREVRVDELA